MATAAQRAREILQAVIARYARLSSYQDRGVVRTQCPDGDSPLELTFETLYSAPNLFRFAFVSPHPYPPLRHITTRLVAGSDGVTAYLRMQGHEAAAHLMILPNIELAVAGATGVSSGSAHTVARLLLPDVGGFALSDLEELALVGETQVEGHLCYRITGNHPRGATHEICIEQNSLLLRSLTKTTANRPSAEIRRDIRIDERLEPERFRAPTQEV